MKFSAVTAITALLAGAAAASNGSSSSSTTTVATTSTTGCWEVSVEHDATYCIEGPICSGSGLEPAGSLCPKKGDVATADCHSYLASYAGDDSCVLPEDATCEVIKTGAWGCVLSSSSSSSSTGEGEAGEGSTSGSAAANATVLAAEAAASAGGISAGVVGAIAAAAAAVCAIAGVALYKQHQKNAAARDEQQRMETFVDVVTP